jgi:hypothetical protein
VRYFVTLLTTAFLPFLAGCASPTVVVMDAQGNPIPEALIYSVSLSMDIGPAKTNARGEARVPSNIQGTHWVDVSKNGYRSIRVEIPTSWPLMITLEEL